MKSKIDKYVSDNYRKLICIAQSKISYFDRHIDAETLVANAYLHVTNCKLDKEEDIPRYLVSYINQELKFIKSTTLRKNVIKSIEYLDTGIVEGQLLQIESIEFQDTIDDFKKNLDRIDQIVWSVYFEKGKTKIREIAEHFNIDMTSAYNYRTRVLKQFKDYYEAKERI